MKQEIRDLRTKVPQVAFTACNNTKNAMEKWEGKSVFVIAEASIVPAGVVRVLELQDALGLRSIPMVSFEDRFATWARRRP